MVGETGFEPATPWSRTKCSTRLSHSPVNRTDQQSRLAFGTLGARKAAFLLPGPGGVKGSLVQVRAPARAESPHAACLHVGGLLRDGLGEVHVPVGAHENV